jgi:hypothetical protein
MKADEHSQSSSHDGDVAITVAPPEEPTQVSYLAPGHIPRNDDSTHSDLSRIGSPSPFTRSVTMDSLVQKVSQSPSLQFSILNQVQLAPAASIEIGNKHGPLLPSQKYALQDHLIRNFASHSLT